MWQHTWSTAAGFRRRRWSSEYPVDINGTAQRADIVAFGSDGRPLVLVECKEHSTRIDNTVFSQAARYNAIVGCRHIVMTNGIETHCWRQESGVIRAGADVSPIRINRPHSAAT